MVGYSLLLLLKALYCCTNILSAFTISFHLLPFLYTGEEGASFPIVIHPPLPTSSPQLTNNSPVGTIQDM